MGVFSTHNCNASKELLQVIDHFLHRSNDKQDNKTGDYQARREEREERREREEREREIEE